MSPAVRSKEDTAGTDTRPLAALSEDTKQAIEKWRRGGFLGKDVLLLALLILGIVVMALLVTLRVLSACPSPQSHRGQPTIRQGIEHKLGHPTDERMR